LTKGSEGLRTVSFGHVDLTGLNVGLMAKVFSGLEVVQLQRAQISTDQLSAILGAIVIQCEGANSRLGSDIRQQRLKLLNISGSDVSKVDPKLLARAVVRLKEITLTYTSLTKEQAKEIMLALSTYSNRTLIKLNIGGNDLSGLDPEVLAMGSTMVTRVSLAGTSLTNDQIISLLTRKSSNNNTSRSSLMTRLNLSRNNLAQVPPQLLAEGIVCLREVALYETNLGNEQVSAILRMAAASNKIRKLLFGVVGCQLPSDELIQRARLNIPHLHLFKVHP